MSYTSVHQLRLTHIGGPTVLIELGSLRLLTDPTFEAEGYQYLAGSQTIRKVASPRLAASALVPLDAVLLSHDQHGDNLDPAGRALLSQAIQTLTTPAGAGRLGGNARGVSPWQTVILTGANGQSVRVTATPACHGPAEIQPAAGDVTGWLIEWEDARRGVLYISGDTVLFKGMEEVATRYHVAVALLHFGAAQAEQFGPFPITLTAVEGARFAAMIGEATIIPIHYEGWSHLTEGHEEIEQAFLATGQEKQLRFLPQGQPVSIEM